MKKEIVNLQAYMQTIGVDGYLALTGDDHGSEYVDEHFKSRAFLTGFTGSAGTLLVCKNSAYLWTDGRYHLQAEEQLKNSGITLMKMGVEGVDSLFTTLEKEHISRLALDFSIATAGFVLALYQVLPSLLLVDDDKGIDEVWKGRPSLTVKPAYFLPKSVTGAAVGEKLRLLREDMALNDCAYALLSGLDDVAWLLNMRGDDIAYNPVNYAFLVVEKEGATLFAEREKFTQKQISFLENNGVKLLPYGEIYNYVGGLQGQILYDEGKTNYRLYDRMRQKKSVFPFPVEMRKAIKNKVEIRGERKAHLLDGVAMVRFWRWLSETVKGGTVTELSAARRLGELRAECPRYIEDSFETICGYAHHGAIVHYTVTPQTDIPLQARGLLLVDSGGQYTCGTTDVTRTFALGKLTKKEKEYFTLVLKGHIALACARFDKDTCGKALDGIARKPLQERGLDFAHGTGHGVGHILNVHEGPQRISSGASKATALPMQAGMVTSNEPGVYVAEEFGIRHETLTLCVRRGEGLCLETLTKVPFDRRGIEVKMLTKQEKAWINAYHKRIFKSLKGYLHGKDLAFLKRETKPLR